MDDGRRLMGQSSFYTASGLPWEAAFAGGLADSRLDEGVGG